MKDMVTKTKSFRNVPGTPYSLLDCGYHTGHMERVQVAIGNRRLVEATSCNHYRSGAGSTKKNYPSLLPAPFVFLAPHPLPKITSTPPTRNATNRIPATSTVVIGSTPLLSSTDPVPQPMKIAKNSVKNNKASLFFIGVSLWYCELLTGK